jgi:hypothetical protein
MRNREKSDIDVHLPLKFQGYTHLPMLSRIYVVR